MKLDKRKLFYYYYYYYFLNTFRESNVTFGFWELLYFFIIKYLSENIKESPPQN